MSHTMTGGSVDPKKLDQVLLNVAALMAMSEDRGATPEEAASAAAKVQELLFKYNLSIAQVASRERATTEAKAKATATDGFTNEYFNVGSKTAWLTEWKQNLLAAIARNNFCFAMVSYDGNVRLVGEGHNLKVVYGMYDYLVKVVARLGNEGWRTHQHYASSHERKWKVHFYEGAVHTIDSRLARMKRASMDELTPEDNALMIAEEDRLNEALYAFKLKSRPWTPEQWAAYRERMAKEDAERERLIAAGIIKPPKVKKTYYQRKGRRDTTDYSAYDAGSRAASSINLDPQVH